MKARNEAKKKNKWLLVNIQRDEEFLSHVLNRSDDYPLPDQSTPPLSSSYYRDVWSDESIQELIQCNFVFWQKQDTSPEGKNFINLYTVSCEY